MSAADHSSCIACGSLPGDPWSLVRTPGASICADCVRVCWEVVRQRQRGLPLLDVDADAAAQTAARAGRAVELMQNELPVQRVAADVLGSVARDFLCGFAAPRSLLLLGPRGSGKTRALRLLREVVGEEMSHYCDLADGEPMADVFGSARVLLLDGMEAIRTVASIRVLTGLLDRSHADGEQVPKLIVAAVRISGRGSSESDQLCAQLGDIDMALRDASSPMLTLATAAGIDIELLARFESYLPLRRIGAEELRRLLESPGEGLVASEYVGDVKFQVGPELSEQLVARALDLGGGAWGLRAVLQALLSDMLPRLHASG